MGGLELRRRRLFAAGERLEALDGVGEQAHVEVEADGADVAALLGAEEVAGAADLEVAQGDLEAGAQLRRLEDGLQALLRDLAQRAVLVVEQVGVGAGGAAADAAAELVELRQAELVGVVDDDRVRVGDVEAGLDDRRADEDVGLAVGELEHHALELVLVHLAVADADLGLGHELAELARDQLDVVDAVVDEVDLAAALHLAHDRLADDVVVELGDVGLDRQALLGRRHRWSTCRGCRRATCAACAGSASPRA